jgi:phosphoesterase RecJ-like protein
MPDTLVRRLLDARRIVLSTHERPDGDAIGSEIAMALYLRARGKEVHVINADPAPHTIDWLPGADVLTVFDGSIAQREAIATADVILVIDTNAEHRLGSVGPPVRSSGAHTVVVDHHTAPEPWFDSAYRRESASSTGELVYEIIRADDPGLIDAPIATALYVAIMTDTGSFRFSNVSPAVHRVVADILERGALDPALIHAEVYDKRTPAGLRLLSRVLQTLTLAHDDQVAWMVVTPRMLQETGSSIEETEGFVNWGLSIEGVRASLLFTETERGTKVSFRSKRHFHVHTWAQALGGGGHANAAGAFVRKPLDETIDRVVAQAPRYLDLEAADGEPDPASDRVSSEDEAYLAALMNLQNREPRT